MILAALENEAVLPPGLGFLKEKLCRFRFHEAKHTHQGRSTLSRLDMRVSPGQHKNMVW